MTIASDIDRLFQLPLDEFTAARNALAAQLKKSGHADQADEVKALAKPPVSAWTANQVYWRHRKAFDELMAVGERFRKAQAAQLAGKTADMRAPLEARREALSELTKLAAAVLREAEHNPSPDTMRHVTTTLEALATYGSHPGAPRAGRLTDDIEPPGFEALAALIPQGGRGAARSGSEPTRVIPFRQQPPPRAQKKAKVSAEEEEKQREAERKTQIAAAKAALQEAERTLRDARKRAEQAEAALKKAAARAKEAEKEKTTLEQRLEKASAEAEEARQAARRVASEAENAAQEVEDAERAIEKARRELRDIGA